MWLMARQAAQRRLHLAHVGRIHHVGNRVPFHWVPQSKPQRQHRYLVLRVVVLGQLYLAVEDRKKVVRIIPLRHRIRPMALQAKRISLRPQQVIDIPSVRRMACRASLRKRRLMMRRLLPQIVDVRMASQADAHGVRLRQPRKLAPVRAVAVRAVAHRPRMRNLGSFNHLRLVVVAGHAKRLDVFLRQYHFPVFGWRMANVALFVGKRRMQEFCHQLGSG